MKLLIKTHNLWLENKRSIIFKNVYLEVQQGEFLWLEGAMGSGKTMLLETLALKRTPSKGSVTAVSNFPICTPKSQLLENESVKNNIRLLFPESKKTDNTYIISELLKSLNLFKLRNISVNTLSRGQKQILRLLTFLALDVELYIFDAPFTFLDNETRLLFIQAAEKKHAAGASIIMSSTLACPGICPADTRHLLLKNGKLSEE